MDNGEQLNFDQAALSGAVEQAAHKFNFLKDALAPGSVLLVFVFLCAWMIFKSFKTQESVFQKFPKIKSWPRVLKFSVVILLCSYLLTHIFSVGSVYYVTRIANPSGEQYFKEMGVGRLLSLSHAHFFAHATMYFVLALLLQFCEGPAFVLVAAPIVCLWSGVFDVIAWWGAKLVSPNFEMLSAVTGTAFSFGFIAMLYVLLKNALCCPRNEAR